MNEENILYAIEKTTLTAIGDVIREADGYIIKGDYPPENMPEAIRSNYDKQRQEGYHEGHNIGYNVGYARGREDGLFEGYINGQKAGREEEQEITDGIITREATSYVNNRIKQTGEAVFRGYFKLQSARFDNLAVISATSFHTCSSLVALIIGAPSVCVLTNGNAFTNTPISYGTGFVYIPDNLVSSYKTATNWSALANSIKPISEYTGELI